MNNTAEGINATALCNNPQKEKNKDENKNAIIIGDIRRDIDAVNPYRYNADDGVCIL